MAMPKTGMKKDALFKAAVIVAHPDDETLWAGGTILMHPEWQWHIITLCRGSDPDRAPKFQRVLQEYKASGQMGDLDDGPEQRPLPKTEVRQTILSLLSQRDFNLILTHSPQGEYTRHRRHEETGQAVLDLWNKGTLHSPELWAFAYGDNGSGGLNDLPAPILDANQSIPLPDAIWEHKHHIITGIYGFTPESYEARIVQRKEAFRRFQLTPVII